MSLAQIGIVALDMSDLDKPVYQNRLYENENHFTSSPRSDLFIRLRGGHSKTTNKLRRVYPRMPKK